MCLPNLNRRPKPGLRRTNGIGGNDLKFRDFANLRRIKFISKVP